MAKEIERKFLVDAQHPDLKALLQAQPISIRQGYLKSDDRGVVRVRTAGSLAYLTVKGKSIGLTRDEFEYEIPKSDADYMLDVLCEKVLEKNRYVLPLENGLVIELDVFTQEGLAPLMVAEVELPSEQTPFDPPAWFGRDVSDDPAYFNNALIERL